MSEAAPRPVGDWSGTLVSGRYLVLEQLGEGSMGAVWLAEDQHLPARRKVVLKVPHAELLRRKGFQQRFDREIESMVALEISGVARILDAGQHEGAPFLVLQFLGGGSLRSRVEAGQTPAQVLDWLPSIARTLDRIHQRGFLHRDVKPDNVLFDADGEVLLADFGISKALGGDDQSITGTGNVPGTPRFMAPEALSTDMPGPAYDQYALALMVYESLAGCLPHDGDTFHTLMVQRQTEAPRPLLEAVPTLDPALAAAVDRALQCRPEDRFPSCSEFAQAFTERARPAATPAGDRRPWVVVAGVLLVVATVSFLLRDDRTDPSTTSTRSEPADDGRLRIEGLRFLGRSEASGLEEYEHVQTGIVLVRMEGGEVALGSALSELGRKDDEAPRTTTLSAYCIARTELTQRQWSTLMEPRRWFFPGPEHPADSLSLADAQAFLALSDPPLLLPTEAQWEAACRAGKRTAFHCGDSIDFTQANYRDQAGGVEGFRQRTTVVASFVPNGFGLYDLHGNVAEWCLDAYSPVPPESERDPRNQARGPNEPRVVRGGSWLDPEPMLRCAARRSLSPGESSSLGLRAVLALPVD